MVAELPDRGTDLDGDLATLLRLYDEGKDVTEPGLRKKDSKLYARLKKRCGTSWSDVFVKLEKRRAGMDARRFFRHAPPGVVPRADGTLVIRRDITGDAALTYLFDLLRERVALNLSVSRQGLKGDKEIWRFFHRVTSAHGLGEIDAISRATGIPPEHLTHVRSGARIYTVDHATSQHADGSRRAHQRLRSPGEAIVDNALAWALGPPYVELHEHDSKLVSLLPEEPRWRGSPFTGRKPPEVDIVLRTRVPMVIEIVDRTDITDLDYKTKLDWKCEVLRAAGVYVQIIRTDDMAALPSQLEAAASAIAERLPAVMPRATATGFASWRDQQQRFKKVTRYTYDQAEQRVRALGIQTAGAYKLRYTEDPGLPGDPQSQYKDCGWTDWFVFLGKPRTGQGSGRRRCAGPGVGSTGEQGEAVPDVK